MRVSDFALEADRDGAEDEAELTPQQLREKAEEKAKMVSLLRHFAEVFGAGEVFREARVIYLETPEGAREMKEEYERVREEDPREHSRQASSPSWGSQGGGGKAGASRRGSRAETALEEARRLLGG